MYPDTQGRMLIHMQQSGSGKWNVNEVGDTHPLASFDDVEECVDYASDLAREKNGIVVQEVCCVS